MHIHHIKLFYISVTYNKNILVTVLHTKNEDIIKACNLFYNIVLEITQTKPITHLWLVVKCISLRQKAQNGHFF